MSLLGEQHVIKVTRVAGNVLVLNSFETVSFTHEAGFVTATSIVKGDSVVQKIGDMYTVKIAYPNGSVPAGSTTLDLLVTAAQTAIVAQYGAPELT